MLRPSVIECATVNALTCQRIDRGQQEETENEQDVIEAVRYDVRESKREVSPRGLGSVCLHDQTRNQEWRARCAALEPFGRCDRRGWRPDGERVGREGPAVLPGESPRPFRRPAGQPNRGDGRARTVRGRCHRIRGSGLDRTLVEGDADATTKDVVERLEAT